jgi:uncharacterized protein
MLNTTFINRKEELKYLGKIYRGKNAFIPIYGRRRIGKTTLVKKFMENKKHIYFLSKKISIMQNIKEFTEEIKNLFKIDYEINFKNFGDLFKFIRSQNQKIIISIDEFPYLAELDKSIPSQFQFIVDEIVRNSKIMLILVGSSITMMEKYILSEKSPLYGRRDGQIKLQPLSFFHIKKFYKNISNEDIIKIYGICGGIPFYLQNLKITSFKKALNIIFNKNNIFYEEGIFLLQEELREPKTYRLILTGISKGKNKFNELVQFTGIEKTALNNYLKVLENLYFIKKETPLLSKPNTKKTTYVIEDEFLKFYFRFIEKYKNKVEIEDFSFFKNFEIDYNLYLGFVFEKIARLFLFKKTKKLFFRQWGSYKIIENRKLKTNVYEIDLLYVDEENKKIYAYEIKWKKLTKTEIEQILEDLKQKLNYLPINISEYKTSCGVIVKEVSGPKVKNCYSLNDVLKV